MRKVWIVAAALTLVAGVALLWPQLMAESRGGPLPGWLPREDAGVLLVTREAGHQEEMAFGSKRGGGVWLRAQSQSNRYDYISMKVAGIGDRGMELAHGGNAYTQEFELAYPVFFNSSFNPPGGRRRLARFAKFTLSYAEPRAAGGKASRLLQRTLKGPIMVSPIRPRSFQPAVIKDLGFSLWAHAEETELRIKLAPARNAQPRFAECWLHYAQEAPDGASLETHTGFKPVEGGLVASIPMSEIGSWVGHTLNTQIEVDVTAEGSAVKVTLKKP